MKREALNHTKMKRLCRRLNLPLWQGVGLLETLWQLTAKQTPRGDVGRLSNEDIAIGIDYRENDLILIDALVESGWVDRDERHRLLIHDWPDHAPDAIHMKLARQKQYFASGAVPKTNRLQKWERDEAHSFFGGTKGEVIKEPLPPVNFVRTNDDSVRTNDQFVRPPCAPPRPPPPPPPSPDPPTKVEPSISKSGDNTNTRVHVPAPNGQLTEWLRPWPRVPNPDAVARAWVTIGIQQEDEPEVFACRDRYLASDEVSRNVVMDPAKFLLQQSQTHWGGKWPHRSTVTNKKLTPTEEAIQEAKARRMK